MTRRGLRALAAMIRDVKGTVSAYRRVGVRGCVGVKRRIGVSACRRVGVPA
jgi:hypothetical protein